MSKLTNIVSQLKEAANELVGRVSKIDEQINGLSAQRDALTSSNVSKEDFLEYMRVHFKRNGARFEREILKSLGGYREYARLERELKAGEGFFGASFLVGFTAPVVVSEEAFYFYFGDVMVDRLSKALDSLDWSEDAIAVSLRRSHIESIERETAELLQQRAELVAMLGEAGITGV